MRGGSGIRVLHGPTDVGGNPTGLARAERRLGIDATVAVFERSRFGYEVDVDLQLGGRGRVARAARRCWFAARWASRYDVLHLNFGRTWAPRLGPIGLDLPLLRAAGRRLFMTFQGCDARRTGYCREHYDVSCCGRDRGPGLCDAGLDAGKRSAVAYAARHCHRLFCLNPDLLRVVPGAEFVPYASVDPAEVVPATGDAPGGGFGSAPGSGSRSDPLTILHAPTDRLVKGTDAIVSAVERLRRDHDVRLLLVENLSHREAMARYREADIVVDQLKVGWYGGFAVEMMAMGRPVVCYVREGDLELIPRAMARELPIVRATTTTIDDVLADLVARPEALADIGRRWRAFVEHWHDPMRIARRMIEVYEDPSRPFWDDTGVLP